MRKSIRLFHRYVGLTVGLLFVLQGLTGSALVFYRALDEQLNPAILLTTPDKSPVPLKQVLEAARSVVPAGAVATRIEPPRHPHGVHTVRFNTTDGRLLLVTIDPYTGAHTATRVWGEGGMSWVYRLHYTLLSGDIGKNIVGISGIVLLGLCAAGLYLWWPRRGQRIRLKVRTSQGTVPMHYDLHRTVGAIAAPALVVITLTGVYLVFAPAIQTAVNYLWQSPEQAVPKQARANHMSAAPVDLDAAVALARRVYPESELTRVMLPRANHEPYQIVVRQPGEPRQNGGLTKIWIERDGAIARVYEHQRAPVAQRVLDWMFPLHNGEALGMTGRLAVAVTGLVPAVLFVTAMIIWVVRRRRRAGRLVTGRGPLPQPLPSRAGNWFRPSQ